jgi:uncharacterized protein YodC (DUF2158 family)
VKLKSGGPVMTAQHDSGNDRWFCQWFDAKGELKSGVFAAAMLVPADPTVGTIKVNR